MRREDCAGTIALECDGDELALIDRMRGETTSRPNMLRVALWSLADHMGYDPALGVFDLHNERTSPEIRQGSPATRTPNPRISQHVAPPKNHPWRRYPQKDGAA